MTAGGHDLGPALALLRRWEGFAARPYRCPAGRATIGYGHVVCDAQGAPLTLAAAEAVYATPLSHEDGETLLRGDVVGIAACVDALRRVELTDCQLAALCCFAFNVGLGAFRRSTLLRHVNANRLSLVPAELRRWCHVDGREVEGLRRRREAEVALWEGRT